MIGKRFGRWTVLSLESIDKHHQKKYLCQCSCGKKKLVFANSLNSGKSTSCGCYQKEIAVETHTKHGMTAGPTYNTWHGMRKRCNNPKDPGFADYGGRGITVCDEWSKFANFLADMGERPEGMTLDRIDNGKGYYKENCRWATDQQQRENRRTQKRNELGITGVRKKMLKGGGITYEARITVDGKEKTLYRGPDFFEACCARKSAENLYSGA